PSVTGPGATGRGGTADSPLVVRCVETANCTERRPLTDPPRRPDMLLLHYTAMASAERAIHWLTTPESGVSCHYVVTEEGEIVQLVPEALRAWHAGVAFWRGEEDINSASIGIEIANPGPGEVGEEFPPRQMQAVRDLARDICARNAIPPARVLAHSDVAPGRKTDPGPLFDWRWLAAEGVGLWPAAIHRPEQADCRIADLQRQLAEIGYHIVITGVIDPQTQTVTDAFRLHWGPAVAEQNSSMHAPSRPTDMSDAAQTLPDVSAPPQDDTPKLDEASPLTDPVIAARIRDVWAALAAVA
ncbi:MAG: N-acetylmuramoyl-L-alanine amidase, partial [Pseudomonadota bacterium]